MIRHPRPLLLVPAAAGFILLSACSSDEGTGTAAATATVTATAAAPTTSSSASASASSPAAPVEEADVSFEDQSGAGDVVRVARVALPVAGFVVVTADDDDGDDDGDDGDDDDRLVGSTALPAGVATDVAVTLAPPLTSDADLEATLFADTDGNGAFDAAVDQLVREDDGDDDDDDVSEDADYDLR